MDKKQVSIYKDTTRYRPSPGEINRPYLIRLISCRNVLVANVSLQKSAMWLQHYLNCDFVTIRNVNIFNHGSRNNDMIDIDGCRNVVISGCYGDSDDDGITLKSTGATATENVTISDCFIRTRTNAIKRGTESSGGFKDITITNCVIQPSAVEDGFSGRKEGLAAIALEIVDGGTMDRVTISNITIKDMAAPIFLRLGNRARPFRPGQPRPAVGTFRNVRISNVIATNAGRNGCSILGIKGYRSSEEAVSKFESVVMKKRIQYKYYKGKWENLPDFINLKPKKSGIVKQFRLNEIGTDKSDFALLMIGFLNIQKSTKYTFYCGSNDGSALTIDNTLLIENDGLHGFRALAGEIYLTKGLHRIEVRYFQAGGSQQLKISWKCSGFEKKELTSENLLVH